MSRWRHVPEHGGAAGEGWLPSSGAEVAFHFLFLLVIVILMLIDFSLFPIMVVDCGVADVEMDRPLHQEQRFDPCDGRSWS